MIYNLVFSKESWMDFCIQVTDFLEDGWQLQGGVAITVENGETKYFQAMIKPKDNKNASMEEIIRKGYSGHYREKNEREVKNAT